MESPEPAEPAQPLDSAGATPPGSPRAEARDAPTRTAPTYHVFPAIAVAIVAVSHYFAFRETSTQMWVALSIGYAPLFAYSLYLLSRDELLGPAVKPAFGDLTRGILGAAMALVVCYGIAVAAIKVVAGAVVRDVVTLAALVSETSPQARVVGIVVFAAVEEVVWRGAVTTALETRFGSRRAPWVASALLVVGVACSGHPSLIVAAIALGAVSAFLVAKSRRLVPSIFAHAAFSWFAVEMLLRLVIDKLERG